MKRFVKKYSIVVDKTFQVHMIFEAEGAVRVVFPSGRVVEGQGDVILSKKARENGLEGVYRAEFNGGRIKHHFEAELRGPEIGVRGIHPLWSRYKNISAFYLFGGVECVISNTGDLPAFYPDSSFAMPSGRLDIPEFCILPDQEKKVRWKSRDCEKMAIAQMPEFEETARMILKSMEDGPGRN